MNEGAKYFTDIMPDSEAVTAEIRLGFDEAFTLHHRVVFRTANAVVRNPALAEDISQEVFLRLYNNLDAIKNEEMLRPWLIRVTLNVAKNTIRGNVRANQREEVYFKDTEERGFFRAQPEKEFEQREQAVKIRQTLDKIKEPLRSCLILKQQGLSYKEIAESLSLNESSIGTFCARARQEFVKFYGKISN